MLYRIFGLLLIVGFSEISWADGRPQQLVTSEVFYDYGEQNQNNTTKQQQNKVYQNHTYERQYVEPERYEVQDVSVVEQQQVPVWPIAGTDADFRITCKEDQGCTGGNPVFPGVRDNDQVRIVSNLGNGMVIENNINTVGTGWSGGPDIINGTQTPVGFDYECINGMEMPLMNREMMEDDGGTVLAMSRSSRRICNKQPDAYAMFARRAGFVPENVVQDGVMVGGTVSGKKTGRNTFSTIDEYDEIYEDISEYTDTESQDTLENQVRSWVVASGQTLREVLSAWCDKEGWDLVWSTTREYPIEASAVFRGRFVDVASALVRNFERAMPVPYAKFYKGNRVLVISTVDD